MQSKSVQIASYVYAAVVAIVIVLLIPLALNRSTPTYTKPKSTYSITSTVGRTADAITFGFEFSGKPEVPARMVTKAIVHSCPVAGEPLLLDQSLAVDPHNTDPNSGITTMTHEDSISLKAIYSILELDSWDRVNISYQVMAISQQGAVLEQTSIRYNECATATAAA